jgi:hypothetical protein
MTGHGQPVMSVLSGFSPSALYKARHQERVMSGCNGPDPVTASTGHLGDGGKGKA